MTNNTKCQKCGRELFDGTFKGGRFSRDGVRWTCDECVIPRDWILLGGKLER